MLRRVDPQEWPAGSVDVGSADTAGGQASANTRAAPKRGALRLNGVSLGFSISDGMHVAVDQMDLAVERGQFVCLLGPSGCGKSTVLNAIAGHVLPLAGTIELDGAPITGPGADRGMVFQQYSLFPWKTVKDNVAFGPRMSGRGASVAEATARTFLALVGLADVADRYPATLSGGMQQRVGIARALANYPSVLLMDEPFGALDAQTRLILQESLLRIWSEFGITVVFVTHDIEEAIFLADRVVIMGGSSGRVLADVTVTLPRPRSHAYLLEPEGVRLRNTCLEFIRNESLRNFGSA
ncbi:MAG: ABC transporter ATP-binding protein [Acidiferrobacteraceae bacterium]